MAEAEPAVDVSMEVKQSAAANVAVGDRVECALPFSAGSPRRVEPCDRCAPDGVACRH